jgi:hypothetical protein
MSDPFQKRPPLALIAATVFVAMCLLVTTW